MIICMFIPTSISTDLAAQSVRARRGAARHHRARLRFRPTIRQLT